MAFLHAESSVLAFITTLHIALAVLRANRSRMSGPFSFVGAVSILFAASPWLMPSIAGLIAGFGAHLCWFIACEQLLPMPAAVVAAPTKREAPAPRPAVAVTRPAVSKPAPVTPTPKAASLPPAPNEFVPCPVLNVIAETPDIRTFRIARPPDFEFAAGQFLAVRVRAEGQDHVRCYSISSAPSARGYLEISVKRVGLVSGTLHATLRAGATLAVKAPAGAFTYPAGEDRPLVLIAGGVGITPMISMLRHAVQTQPTRPVSLFYSVKSEADIAFRDELTFLRHRHPQLRVVVAVTGPTPPPQYFPGRISESLIARSIPDLVDASCYLCGPPPMLDTMRKQLGELGVPERQIHFEVFNPTVAAAAGVPKVAAPAPLAAEAPPTAAATATFTRSGVTATIEDGQSLLETSESCGASIPSLCRAGVCGTCRTRVTDGDVDCQSSILSAQDRAEGFVLACVSRPHSDCTVDA